MSKLRQRIAVPQVAPTTAEPSQGGVAEFLRNEIEDGRVRIAYRFENDSLWLSQAFIGKLHQSSDINSAKERRA